jgi:hypothetical protein
METFIDKTFGLDDIQGFLDSKKEESINLEYKRSDSLKITDHCKDEISKDVSSFANSDGGIIIYGIEEKNHQASNLSFIDGNVFTKEWLEQVISSRIHRKIDGLLIDPIRYNNSIQQSLYVVKIPRSYNVPHMASNKKYYKRHNFESIEMEEYEIRDLYSRHSLTKLKICPPRIYVTPRSASGNKHIELGMIISIDIENISNRVEKDFKLEVRIPRPISSISDKYGPLFNGTIRNDGDYAIYSLPNSSPIFQEEVLATCTFELKITKKTYNDYIEKLLVLTLFYTDGIDRKQIVLGDHLTFNGRSILIQDFE